VQGTTVVRWACAGVFSLALFWPMDPAPADEERVSPRGQETTCAEVLDGEGGWELKQDTDPSDGSGVGAGDVVEMRMT
jgi:hypothetical protein